MIGKLKFLGKMNFSYIGTIPSYFTLFFYLGQGPEVWRSLSRLLEFTRHAA